MAKVFDWELVAQILGITFDELNIDLAEEMIRFGAKKIAETDGNQCVIGQTGKYTLVVIKKGGI